MERRRHIAGVPCVLVVAVVGLLATALPAEAGRRGAGGAALTTEGSFSMRSTSTSGGRGNRGTPLAFNVASECPAPVAGNDEEEIGEVKGSGESGAGGVDIKKLRSQCNEVVSAIELKVGSATPAPTCQLSTNDHDLASDYTGAYNSTHSKAKPQNLMKPVAPAQDDQHLIGCQTFGTFGGAVTRTAGEYTCSSCKPGA